MGALERTRRYLALAAAGAIITGLAGCGGSSFPTGAVTEHAAGSRFTVTISAPADRTAGSVGVNLPQFIAHALDHISALLPGPSTVITVGYGPSQVVGHLIPQTGTNGVTYTATSGNIVVNFGATAQVSLRRSLFWLQRDLAHEVNHTARMRGPGAGFGVNLLDEMMTEATASVFAKAAFPGAAAPYDEALTPGQECAMWTREMPLLYVSDPGGITYDQWIAGGGGVLRYSLFTIGYHIATDYLREHQDVDIAALTALPAKTILDGSHYQPCPG